MNGLALDSGEFISAAELNAKWLPRKATEEEMIEKQPEALPVRLAKRLCDGISTGHDWPNTDDELLRIQSAAELRRLHAENEALRAQSGQGEPVGRVAWAADVENTIKEVRWTVFAPPVDTLLYVHPAPQQEPLTRYQVKDMCAEAGYAHGPVQARADFINGIRHAEAAHNIGEEQ